MAVGLVAAAGLAAGAAPAFARVAREIVLTPLDSVAPPSALQLGPMVVDPVTQRGYVLEGAFDDVLVYDISGSTLAPLARIDLTLGRGAKDLAVNTFTHRVLVLDGGADRVVMIDGDPASATVDTVLATLPTMGTGGQAIAVDPGENLAYVANAGSSDVSVMDLAPGGVTLVPVDDVPDHVVVDSSFHRAFVSSAAGSTITPIAGRMALPPVVTPGVPKSLALGGGYVLAGLTSMSGAGEEWTVAAYDELLGYAGSTAPLALDSPAASIAVDDSILLVYVTTESGKLLPFELLGLLDEGSASLIAEPVGAVTVDPATHRVLTTTFSRTEGRIALFDTRVSPLFFTQTSWQTRVGSPWSAQVAAVGNPGTMTYSVVDGELPPGITLSPFTGVLSGTPTVADTYNVTFSASNGMATTGLTTLTIEVLDGPPVAPVITSGPPPAGVVGTAYPAFRVTASGSPAPRFAVTHGSLPAGLTLDAETGVISGTPNTEGRVGFTIGATNSSGTNSVEYSIVIAPAVPPTPTPTPTPSPTTTPSPSPTPAPTGGPSPSPSPTTAPAGTGSSGIGGSGSGNGFGRGSGSGSSSGSGSGHLASTGVDGHSTFGLLASGGLAVGLGLLSLLILRPWRKQRRP